MLLASSNRQNDSAHILLKFTSNIDSMCVNVQWEHSQRVEFQNKPLIESILNYFELFITYRITLGISWKSHEIK